MDFSSSISSNNNYGRGFGIPVNIKSKADQYIKVREKGVAKPFNLKVVSDDGYLYKRGVESLKSQEERGVKEILEVPEAIRDAASQIDIKL